MCTSLAKLATLTVMRDMRALWPRVQPPIFTDDVALAETGVREQVVRDIGDAAEFLEEQLDPMGCAIPHEKRWW